ncbi:hypothetical protein ACIRS1_28820 [Kitasatospora sp. NPDC101176]|uniref:hypothetical protein n=1 Tax=Kitasatospora sp. NPDC101176 TaxID=3364099 RepID=UPI00381B60E4
MNRPPGGHRVLRIVALPLAVGGLAVHLWLGTKAGLAVAGAGLAAHLVAAFLGRRWLERRDRAMS